MASTCPKCHSVIEDDSVCCAEVHYTWKCKSCGKLTTGFVVPYGRCFLCGGENQLLEDFGGTKPDQVKIVQEAVQFKVNMYQFYRLAMQRTTNEELRGVLEELYQMEEDYLKELERKYHLHLDPDLLHLPEKAEHHVAAWIFEDIDFKDEAGHVPEVYDRAIAMERKTRDYFLAHAEVLPPGLEKETYRELAAEEEDHLSMLETEREQMLKDY